jgi:hypothetical protein
VYFAAEGMCLDCLLPLLGRLTYYPLFLLHFLQTPRANFSSLLLPTPFLAGVSTIPNLGGSPFHDPVSVPFFLLPPEVRGIRPSPGRPCRHGHTPGDKGTRIILFDLIDELLRLIVCKRAQMKRRMNQK